MEIDVAQVMPVMPVRCAWSADNQPVQLASAR